MIIDNNYYYTVPDSAVSGILADAMLLRDPLKAESDNWQETAHHWLVTIGGQTFDYYTGGAHVTEKGTPKKPSLDDVLHALVSDATACDESFEDWCDNYGYNSDSRKALAIYLQCQENAKKLRKAGVNIAAERERLADY